MKIHKIYEQALQTKKNIVLEKTIEIEPAQGNVEDVIAVIKEVAKEVPPHVFWVNVIEVLERKEEKEI
jgi:hypothetical protein